MKKIVIKKKKIKKMDFKKEEKGQSQIMKKKKVSY